MRKLLLLVLVIVIVALLYPALQQTAKMQRSGSSSSSVFLSASSVVGPPTLSADFLNKVLTAYHSPSAGKGEALYDDGVRFHIDPAFALAFFLHESDFGTRGEARFSKSLGNLRCLPTYPCMDGYAWFPSWEEGFHAWYALIAGDLYVGAHLTTVEQIVPRYAPAGDNNDEQAYCQTVDSAVKAWRAGQVQV
jgi:hypothetical protein